ncbi:cytosolic phospholipase A2 gamma-like isoform X2 [Protopterus annectens]|nr:cytosolic phospholipase A2 gamma-like isoform X2 [Protopterus annectens]
MISLAGTLEALNEAGLLNCVTYLCGVSGSTWCMSSIYDIQDWTKFDVVVQKIKDQITKARLGWREMIEQLEITIDEDTFSLTDIWAVFVAYFMTHQINKNKLSEHRKGIEDGKKPYPIYTAVPVTITYRPSKDNWMEFTPDHVGFTELKNSFLQTEDYGSKFDEGQIVMKKTEPNLCYLDGLWGSAIVDIIPEWKDEIETLLENILDEVHKALLEESVEQDIINLLEKIKKNIKDVISWKWGTTNNQLYNYPESSGSGIPDYISKMKFLHLKDAGLLLNAAYPVVLCEERTADLILSFDFSEGDPFQTIKYAKEYCDKNNIMFPDVNEAENADVNDPNDCYIFKGNKGEKKPTVMHLPLFNNVNCKGPDGIQEYRKEFSTRTFDYTEESFSKLIAAAKANVQNNIDLITEQIENLVTGNGK